VVHNRKTSSEMVGFFYVPNPKGLDIFCLASARLYYGLRIAGEKYFNKILNKKFGG
jgi:hypothetical protein